MSAGQDLDEDARQVRSAAAALLDVHYPVSRLRQGRPDDLAQLAAFGAFSLALPEARGGAGFGPVEEVMVHVLLGRHLVSTRALAAAVGARLAAALDRPTLSAAIGSGSTSVCVALPSAETLFVVEGEGTEFAVVFGAGSLSLVDLGGAPGETVAGLGHDLPLARRAPGAGAVVGEASGAALRDAASLLVCAELLGCAEAARDLAVAYAGVRRQFGRPIGAFQAVKHRCADMAIGAEALSALLDRAALATRDGNADATFQIAALTLLAPRTALFNARACIQLHGGIGFSAEADPHHYLKRAHLLARIVGGAPMLDVPAPLAPYSSVEGR